MTERDQEVLRNIAGNVLRLRTEEGLSMRALAEKAGDYAPTIKRIEDEENMPGAGLLARIAEALGVTANDLLAKPATQGRKKNLSSRLTATL